MLLNMRTTFEAPTGDSADRVIWSWGINGPSPTETEMTALADAVEASLIATDLPGAPTGWKANDLLMTGYRPLYHEVFDAQGGPALAVRNATNDPDPVGGASAGPTEVQIVVSRLINTARGLAPVGRIYFGPVGSASGLHPSIQMRETVVGWARHLHDLFVTVGYTPEVIAKAGTVLAAGKPIAGYSVDDLWDTQRRRGIAQPTPGAKITLAV